MSVHEHKEKSKKSIRCFVITVSDTRDEMTDTSGQTIKGFLTEEGHQTTGYRIVKDEPAEIESLINEALGMGEVDAVIVNGGTGIAPRDGTYGARQDFDLFAGLQGRGDVGDGKIDSPRDPPHGFAAAGKMKVRVKFFAILRERTGTSEVAKEIAEGSTVAELWRQLQKDYPRLDVPGIRLLYAVNQDYVGVDHQLKDKDEVVFVPPVSGG